MFVVGIFRKERLYLGSLLILLDQDECKRVKPVILDYFIFNRLYISKPFEFDSVNNAKSKDYFHIVYDNITGSL